MKKNTKFLQNISNNQQTEVERIITEGILPESFLLPEIICDFYVDEYRKKIWAIGIDLLIQFDKVCKKHNLKYFLSFGTLLGAVRHKGFVPWDDDIDVNMVREDYEKLKSLRSEFEDPYFLQYPGCDKEYYFSFAKLRNSKTTGISSSFRYNDFNQGIWIDIFPMDNCDLETLEQNAADIKKLIAENSAWMRSNNPYLSESEKEMLVENSGRNPKIVFDEIELISRQYENLPTKYVTCANITVYKPLKMTYKKSDLENLILYDYYGYKFPIPANYDVILKTTYDNYMQFPPVEKRGVWHNISLFNPDIPYQETLKILHQKDKCIE